MNMGVDLGYINQRQAELAQQQAARAAGGVPYWSPADGTSKIRLLGPWADNVKSFEREVMMHYGVGENEQAFSCPGPGCPICAHVEALRATNDPSDVESANRMSKKKRYYSNIVDLNDPVWTQKDYQEFKQGSTQEEPSWKIGQTKVQVFGYGAMIFGQLINMFAQLGMDLTDLNNGYDLLITRTGVKLSTKYTIIPAPPARPLNVQGALHLTNLDVTNLPRKHEDMVAALATSPGGAGVLPPNYGATPPVALPQQTRNASPAPQLAAPPPPAAQPQVAPKPAQQAAKVQTLAPPTHIEPPMCFKDANVFSETDPECVGGVIDGENLDRCPFFQACGEATGKLVASPKGRRRAAPAKVEAVAGLSDADILEKQMQEALQG
jgi:pyruvate/2-oxoglutarate dehydrogenase complex dihydrolipoamide acyltransferase (E2) component